MNCKALIQQMIRDTEYRRDMVFMQITGKKMPILLREYDEAKHEIHKMEDAAKAFRNYENLLQTYYELLHRLDETPKHFNIN